VIRIVELSERVPRPYPLRVLGVTDEPGVRMEGMDTVQHVLTAPITEHVLEGFESNQRHLLVPKISSQM